MLDLLCGHDSLRRGVGDSHEALTRFGDVGDVAERSPSRDQHVGRDRQTQRRVGRRVGVRRKRERPRARRPDESEKPVGDAIRSAGKIVEPKPPLEVRRRDTGGRKSRRRGFDGHTRQRRARVVRDRSGERPGKRGAGNRGRERPTRAQNPGIVIAREGRRRAQRKPRKERTRGPEPPASPCPCSDYGRGAPPDWNFSKSSTSSRLPIASGIRAWRESGTTSRTRRVPVDARPPACSTTKARGWHS